MGEKYECNGDEDEAVGEVDVEGVRDRDSDCDDGGIFDDDADDADAWSNVGYIGVVKKKSSKSSS